jgi:hypothetical protein
MLTPESFSASGGSNPGAVGITVKSEEGRVNICQRRCGNEITDLYADQSVQIIQSPEGDGRE